MKLYHKMAVLLQARENCKRDNKEWLDMHTEQLEDLLDNLPHGSGLDYTWLYDYQHSNGNRVVLSMSFHAMDENGFYDGIIDFTVSITPSLVNDFNLSITGKFGKRQDIKDYLYQIINEALYIELDS